MASPSRVVIKADCLICHQQSRRLTENPSASICKSLLAGVAYSFTRFTCCFQVKAISWETVLSNRATKLANYKQMIPSPSPKLPNRWPSASAAISNVPSEEAVSTPKQGKTDSPNRNRPVVRGIATQLSSHTLVLVTARMKF